MRGRKRTPSNLKLVRGNPGKRKLPADEPKPDPSIPACPKHLNETERALWYEIGEELIAQGILTNIDAGIYEIYITGLAMIRRVKPEIEKALIFQGPNGGAVHNPYLAIYNKAKEQVMKSGAELGLSPASRSRVSVKKPKKEENPFEKWKNKRKA